MKSECEKPGHFYICHPSHVSKPSIKETGILRSRSHHPPTASIQIQITMLEGEIAAPPLAPIALSPAIGRSVSSLTAN